MELDHDLPANARRYMRLADLAWGRRTLGGKLQYDLFLLPGNDGHRIEVLCVHIAAHRSFLPRSGCVVSWCQTDGEKRDGRRWPTKSVEKVSTYQQWSVVIIGFFLAGCASEPVAPWVRCENTAECEIEVGYYCGVVAVNAENKAPLVEDVAKWYAKSSDSMETCAKRKERYVPQCRKGKCEAVVRDSD